MLSSHNTGSSINACGHTVHVALLCLTTTYAYLLQTELEDYIFQLYDIDSNGVIEFEVRLGVI